MWEAAAPSVVASGLEATIHRVQTRAYGTLAIKMFASRAIDNDNDQGLDSRDFLRQDALAFEHLVGCGLPAPRVIALHFGASIDFLAYSFVETDGTHCSPAEMGKLARRLHEAPLPGFMPVAHRGNDRFEGTAAALICRRLDVVRCLSALDLPEISEARLASSLSTSAGSRALLHMDLRPANVLCVGGRAVAWIDWSNAVIANPVLELARIGEYGLPFDEIVAGYGHDPLEAVPPSTMIAARLYTAVMLAVLYLSEAPDAERAVDAVKRVRELLLAFDAAA